MAVRKYVRYLCGVAIARKPVHELLAVLFERPKVAVLEKHCVCRLKFFQECRGSARKSFGHILVVRCQKFLESYLHLAYIRLFSIFSHCVMISQINKKSNNLAPETNSGTHTVALSLTAVRDNATVCVLILWDLIFLPSLTFLFGLLVLMQNSCFSLFLYIAISRLPLSSYSCLPCLFYVPKIFV